MAKKEKVEKPVKVVDTSIPDFVCWEKITGKSLAKFVLTASTRNVTGTFTSEGKRFRTDMRGLTPEEIQDWMQAIHFCVGGNPVSAQEHLQKQGFTAEIAMTELFVEEEPEVMAVIMDGEPAEVEIEMEEEDAA